MTPELIDDGPLRTIQAGRFRLAFRWSGDRWEHMLEARPRDRDAFAPLAWTIEGAPDRDDPVRIVNPAYQQLEFQHRGDAMQALLVGQLGPHHFSAVFAVKVLGPPGAVTVRVDVADRCRGAIEALASTYWVAADSGELVAADEHELAWDLGPNRLAFAATGPARVAFGEGGRRTTQAQVVADRQATGPTRRWEYLWRWDPDVR